MWIEWTDDAQEELWAIIDYIDDYNSQAALQLYGDIVAAAETLPSFTQGGSILNHQNRFTIRDWRVSIKDNLLSMKRAT